MSREVIRLCGMVLCCCVDLCPSIQKTSDGRWTKDDYVEVLDTARKWLPAQVIRISEADDVFVHYDGWSSKWDEWIAVRPMPCPH